MKKLFLLSLIALFLVSISLVAAAPIELSAPATIYLDAGTSNSSTFNVTNVNATYNITSVAIALTNSNLTNASTVTFSGNSSTLLNNSTQTVTVNVAIPNYTANATYTAKINVSGIMNGTNVSNTTDLQVVVNPKFQLDILNALSLSTFAEKNSTVSLSIQNTGNINLSGIQLRNTSVLNDSDNNNITFTFPANFSLYAGETKTVTFNVSVPENMMLGSYSTSIIANSSTGANDSTSLSIDVIEQYCEEGNKGSIINFIIDDPDSGDDFNVGESIKLKLKIKNTDDESHDFVVSADLYDLNNSKMLDANNETTITIDEDDSETVYLILTIPSDTKKNHTIAIYAKAYIDDSDYAEDEQCIQKSVNIDVKRQKHDVKIASFELNPASMACGDTTEAVLGIENVGDNDEESVRIRVYNTVLGINSSKIIDNIDSGDDSTQPFTLIVPSNTNSGNYTLNAEVSFYYKSGTYHDSNARTTILELKGGSCVGNVTNKSQISILNSTGIAGSELTIPVSITNNESVSVTYTFSATGYESWANVSKIEPASLTIAAGNSGTAFVYLTPKSNATGVQSFTITTTYGGKSTSQTASVNVQSSSAIASWFDQLMFELKRNPVWITIDIALIAAIIYVFVWLIVKK